MLHEIETSRDLQEFKDWIAKEEDLPDVTG
jgi:hypothetical protein